MLHRCAVRRSHFPWGRAWELIYLGRSFWVDGGSHKNKQNIIWRILLTFDASRHTKTSVVWCRFGQECAGTAHCSTDVHSVLLHWAYVTCQLKADHEVLFWHGFGTASGFDYVERLSLRGWVSVDSAVGPYRTWEKWPRVHKSENKKTESSKSFEVHLSPPSHWTPALWERWLQFTDPPISEI